MKGKEHKGVYTDLKQSPASPSAYPHGGKKIQKILDVLGPKPFIPLTTVGKIIVHALRH
jgi:hypothetical protein